MTLHTLNIITGGGPITCIHCPAGALSCRMTTMVTNRFHGERVLGSADSSAAMTQPPVTTDAFTITFEAASCPQHAPGAKFVLAAALLLT